jgi:CubicO group peptidase (beta-lactamase class C family)
MSMIGKTLAPTADCGSTGGEPRKWQAILHMTLGRQGMPTKFMRCAPLTVAALLFIASAIGIFAIPGNIDVKALESIKMRIKAGEFSNIHGLLVFQHDRPIGEWYFDGQDERRGLPIGIVKFGRDTLHDIRSITKSVVSLLFGIAMADGAINNLDSPVLRYFPEYKDVQTPERIKIKLRDLLCMMSGLHWDEQTYSYLDRRNSETAMDLAPDRYHYILSQPIDSPPGKLWRYSGGDVALITQVIARATKMPIETYAQEKLFRPMGITQFEWLKDAKGIPYAASGLRLLPRDMAKLGLLILHHGRANGRQIVPTDWIAAATTPYGSVNDDPVCATKYGYFWWLAPRCPIPWFAGIGNGGQRIWIEPSLDAVIITTAGLYNNPQQSKADELVSTVTQVLAKAAASN